MTKRGALIVLCLVAFSGTAFAAASQEKYPSRAIRLLIPFPACGASDTIGRAVGEQLAAQAGQPVVIYNRPGAAGRLATEILMRGEPDGYTLLVGGDGPMSISPAV
jgi:tripartite-type tricarboxylate transporter receptor subunit TctC